MDATIVVHLQGGPEQAFRCVASLARLPEEPSFEVIVVDDASTGLDELLAQLDGDLLVLPTQGRVGFGASVALAAARASSDALVLLRDAPEVGDAWLAPLLAELEDPQVALAASRTLGEARPHPVAAHAIALRACDADVLEAARSAPAGLEVAAICTGLAARGRLETVRASVVQPPGARMNASRRAFGEQPELTVVIPTIDACAQRVRRCVAAIQRATDVPHEIVVLDNGAPPQGFTAPVNAGLRAARGRYMVVLNDDVEVLAGWWPPLRDALDAGARVVFPLTVEGEMRHDFAAWCFALDRATLDDFSVAPGEFLDPQFRVWFQDTDLLVRLRAAGCPPVCVEQSHIRHGLSETVATEDPGLRAWIKSEVVRDQQAFMAKHPGVLRPAQLTRA